MTSLFPEGGPLNVQRTGRDDYSMRIPIPTDALGRIARECPVAECSPGYFKVTPGTGITEDQTTAYCPYCRHAAEFAEFQTEEQVRFAKDMMIREAHKGIDRMFQDTLGFGPSGRKRIEGDFLSMEMTYKPGTLPNVRNPFEEEIQRDIVCPHCGLDHVVFGLATWCGACGQDIFLTHVRAEFDVVQKMLGDIARRQEALGPRVGARDIDNALEDVVSIYEATLKAMIDRRLRMNDLPEEEILTVLRKNVGNRCHSVHGSGKVIAKLFQVTVFDSLSEDERTTLAQTFEKRHPITHNLGVVDRKYLEHAISAEREEREVRVTPDEITGAIDSCLRVFDSLQMQLFSEQKRLGHEFNQ